MKKHFLITVLISGLTFFLYFQFGTRWTGKISQELDHYNSLAHAFREHRLDIRNTPVTDELSQFNGKWYPYYGPLPAFLIAFLQIVSHKDFIPTLYPNALIGSLGVGVMYLLFVAFKKTYYEETTYSPLVFTFLFAFGTVQFWVSTRSGIWFQAQTYALLFSSLGLLSLLSKKRRLSRYFLSVLFFSFNLFTRPHTALLLIIPFYLFLSEYGLNIKKLLIIFSSTALFLSIFFTYNYARFFRILETGVGYQKFHYQLANRYAQAHGWFNIINVPYNLWFMTLEIPKLTLENGFTPLQRIKLVNNPEGNSIFFLTPPFLALFLARPWKERVKLRKQMMSALWLGVLLTLVPILLLTGTGWQQFGYRYTLDVTPPLFLLVIFGIEGKPNILFHLGVIFSLWMYTAGVLFA